MRAIIQQVSVVALLVGALTPVSAHAYTVKRTEGGATVRWHAPTVGLQVDPSLARLLPSQGAARAVEMAAEAWRGLPNVPDLVVQQGNPGPLGYDGRTDNGVYLADPWPVEPGRLAVTVTSYDAASGRILDTDILINPAYPFELLEEPAPGEASAARRAQLGQGAGRRSDMPYDLASVLAHEMGHALGLGESHDDEAATMWPRLGRGHTHQRTLEVDDEAGAMAVYEGADLVPASGCGGSSVARGRQEAAFPIALALLLLALGAVALRQRRAAAALGAVVAIAAAAPTMDRLAAQPHAEQPAGQAMPAVVAASQVAHRLRGLDPETLVVGRAHREDVVERAGILWTRYEVRSADGSRTELLVPGGRRGDVVQHVGHAAPPPDGAEVALAPREDGPQAWALHHAGVLWSGWLADGPAVELGR